STPAMAQRPQPHAELTLSRGRSETRVRGQKPDEGINPLNFEPGIPRQGIPATRIRAVVNDVAILEEEVIAAAFHQLAGAQTEAEKAQILNAKLNEIIDREVVLQDAEAKLSKNGPTVIQKMKKFAREQFEKEWLHKMMQANKYTDEKAFREYMASGGISVDLIQRQWERSLIAMEYLRGKFTPILERITHQDINDYYDQNLNEFKVEERIEWQDIFILKDRFPTPQEAKSFAESLLVRLHMGQDFVALSKQYDHGESSLREKSFGLGTKRGEIRPAEVEPTLLSLKEGQVGPLIEMDHGFHIVKLYSYTPAGIRPFDDKIQRAIKNKLQNEAFNREMKRFVQDLRRRSVIQIAERLD
ncbi:MAG: peptidyl-prolyl cis-trans isomerase, partial [Gemmataceae bacterium]